MLEEIFGIDSFKGPIGLHEFLAQYRLSTLAFREAVIGGRPIFVGASDGRDPLLVTFVPEGKRLDALNRSRANALSRIKPSPQLLATIEVVKLTLPHDMFMGAVHFAVVQEAPPLLTLDEVLGNALLTHEDAKVIFHGILDALDDLKKRGVSAAGLRPANIFVGNRENLQPKLRLECKNLPTDLASRLGEVSDVDLSYCAPELVYPDRFNKEASSDLKADFWALGLLFLQMTGYPHPFSPKGKSKQELAQIIATSEPKVDWDALGPQWGRVLRALLSKDVKARPATTDEVRKIFSGELKWVEKVGTKTESIRPATIDCVHCHSTNPPGTKICKVCDMPVKGGQMSGYRRPLVYGLVFVFLAVLYWLPFGVWDVDVIMQEQEPWWKDLISRVQQLLAERNNADGEEAQQRLAIALLAWGGYTVVMWMLMGLFRTIWMSKALSNAHLFAYSREVAPWWGFWTSFAVDALGLLLLLAYGFGLILLLAASIFRLWAYQRIWRASKPGIQPAGWKAHSASVMVFFWWVSGMLMPLFLLLHFFPAVIEAFGLEAPAKEWAVVAFVLSASYWALSLLMVIRLTWRQRRRYQDLA